MKNFFWDYIYYRMVQAYSRWEKNNGNRAVVGVSMIQSLLIIDVLMFYLRYSYSTKSLSPYSKKIAWFSVAIFVVISIANEFVYKDKYESLRAKWESESSQERSIKGVLVVLSLVIPWIPLFWLGLTKSGR